MSAPVHAVLFGRRDVNGSLFTEEWAEGALLTFSGLDSKKIRLRIPEPRDVRALALALLAVAGPVSDREILDATALAAQSAHGDKPEELVRLLRAWGFPATLPPAGSPEGVLCGLEDGRVVAFTDCGEENGLEILTKFSSDSVKEEPTPDR